MDIPDLISHAANERLGFSIFSSYELLQFAHLDGGNCPQLPYLGKLLGEVLFRKCNIYIRHSMPHNLDCLCSSTQFSELTRFMSGSRDAVVTQEWLLDAVKYYEQRRETQNNASGFFPLLLKEHNEALPVPFQITESMDAKVFDSCDPPNEIPAWSNVLNQIRESVDKPLLCFKVLIPIGKMNYDTGGSSLMLPVILASHDMLLRPPSMSFLASGNVAHGVIEKVGGLEIKEQLASAMGLKFITNGSRATGKWPSPDLNEVLTCFLERWQNFHEEKLLCDLEDPQKAIELVERWSRKVESRATSSERSVKLFEAAMTIIENSPDEEFKRDAWRAKLCLGMTLNHLGETKRASLMLENVTSTLQGHQCPELIKSMTAYSVSLTSNGEFGLAEQICNQAIDFAKKLMTGTRIEKIIAEVRARGCLGGTVFYQQGTWDEGKKVESRKHLEKAIELIDPYVKSSNGSTDNEIIDHWAMDFCQLQQWNALFEPKSFLETYQETLGELVSRLPENLLNKHLPYLSRCRWLAAQRSLILESSPSKDWADWELPRPLTRDQEWLLALSYKSKGALMARNGEYQKAASTFDDAISILDNGIFGTLPLLMAGSVCLMAKISLSVHEPVLSTKYSDLGKNLFEKLKSDGFCKTHPKISPNSWLLAFSEDKFLDTPQKYFVH